MDKNEQLERGGIPKGTRIKLYEGRVTLLEDVVVDANQEWIDKAIKDQDNYFKGVSRVGGMPKKDGYITIHSPMGSVEVKLSKDSL